ncbi:hypothetical protein Gura_2990 [Geotalea uraniireducens Rf4]|uniref:Uncharacterized protein n=1 Tax=Geotalea uraniireducens (strain Rf4) TaxID=351605 RepID=A5G5U4_GEOUR|nr:hypothetical protein Gura_2990 [Geotalea uraniireducens Rf4]
MPVAGAFMPRSNDIISPRHVRDETDFSRFEPGDESPGYMHTAPPGRLKTTLPQTEWQGPALATRVSSVSLRCHAIPFKKQVIA